MSVNRVQLIGRVGKDPDVKEVGNTKVAQFSLATSERGYTKQDGTEVPEKTYWHNIVLWGKKAEVAEKYIHKGDLVFVEGRITYREWEDNNGKHYRTEIVGDSNLELLTPKGQGGQQGEAPQPAPTPNPFDNQMQGNQPPF